MRKFKNFLISAQGRKALRPYIDASNNLSAYPLALCSPLLAFKPFPDKLPVLSRVFPLHWPDRHD